MSVLSVYDSESLSVYQTLSHEIRTPLNAIVGFSQLMRVKLNDPLKLEEYIQGVVKHSGIIENLLNDLLIISQIENKQLKISTRNNSLDRLFDKIKKSTETRLTTSGYRDMHFAICYFHEGTNPFVTTDHCHLKYVFTKLIQVMLSTTISNTIWFGCHSVSSEQVTLFVSDERNNDEHNGWNKALPTQNAAGKSFVDLSIAEAIVAMLGGKIWLHPIIGAGTTFYFTIKDQK